MHETVSVENTGPSDLTLPCGTRVRARKSAPVRIADLAAARENPVVQHWFATRLLRTDGEVPFLDRDDSPALMERLRGAMDDARRFAAERDAARDDAAAALTDLAAIQQHLTVAEASLSDERNARAEAEELARLVSEEVEALKAAAKAAASSEGAPDGKKAGK